MRLRAQIVWPASLALSYWARDMQQRVAYLKHLYHACVWTLASTGIRLRLFDQPLLGNSLTTLAAGSYRTEETEPAISSKVKKGGAGPLLTPELNRLAKGIPSRWLKKMSADHRVVNPVFPPQLSPSQGKSQSGQSKIKVNKLPLQVEYPLLCRLAGETVLAPGKQGDRDPAKSDYGRQLGTGRGMKKVILAPAARRDDPLNTQPMVWHQRLRAESLSPKGKRADSQTWQDSMVKRTAQAFIHSDFRAVLPIQEVASVLGRQWASQVTGPVASIELLQAAGAAVHKKDVPPRKDARMTSSAGNDGSPLWLLTAPEKANRPPLVKEPGSVSSPAKNQELPIDQGRTASQVPWQTPKGTTDLDLRTLAEYPDLPPLVPPQSVGKPVLPVAAEIAHQEAWSEAVTAEDGLEVLAEKVKRILEEEARRHGIDV